MATVAAIRARRLILAGVLAAAFGASPATVTSAATHLTPAGGIGSSATSTTSDPAGPTSPGTQAKTPT